MQRKLKLEKKKGNIPEIRLENEKLNTSLNNLKISGNDMNNKNEDNKTNADDINAVRSRAYMDDPREYKRIHRKLEKLKVRFFLNFINF